jgi:hypothetical protein
MRLWSAKPDSEPAIKPKKRAYEDLSDQNTQDGESVGEPESLTRSKAASDGTNEMDNVDQDKPTQSDCMSIDYSPNTAEDPEERAGTTPVPPGGDDQWGNQSGGSKPDPKQKDEHRWLLRWMTCLDQESRDTDPEPVDLMSMPEDLEDATAEQLEALLPTPPTLPTWEEVRGRLTAIRQCFAMC